MSGTSEKEVTVQVKEGQTLKQDFKLVAVGVEGEEVVVTAQAAGQKEAINQQISLDADREHRLAGPYPGTARCQRRRIGEPPARVSP